MKLLEISIKKSAGKHKNLIVVTLVFTFPFEMIITSHSSL